MPEQEEPAFSFRPMDEAAARAIVEWRYEGIYPVYHFEPNDIPPPPTPETAWGSPGNPISCATE